MFIKTIFECLKKVISDLNCYLISTKMRASTIITNVPISDLSNENYIIKGLKKHLKEVKIHQQKRTVIAQAIISLIEKLELQMIL